MQDLTPTDDATDDESRLALVDRRTRDGKTTREAVRCLKRYLARHLYRLLQEAPIPT